MSKNRMSSLALVAAIAVAAAGVAVFALASDRDKKSHASANSGPDDAVYVEIEAPTPVDTDKKKSKNPVVPGESGCHGGCSLAKHEVAEFTVADYRAALESYADAPHNQPSEGLEALLFYNKTTALFLEEHGTGPLSPEHQAFLRRELRREHALVSIRMVDSTGTVRVNYGPEKVPFGVKEHLKPANTGSLHAMEFNGTVMRTGLYHLWSRY